MTEGVKDTLISGRSDDTEIYEYLHNSKQL